MRTILKNILIIAMILAARYTALRLPIQKPQIRNIGETQQQLIDAGYENVYVPEFGEFRDLTVDYNWGPITEAAYC